MRCAKTARQRGNSSLDTGKRGTHSEAAKRHRFSTTMTDTPLFQPKPLNSTSSRSRYTRSCSMFGAPDKPASTDGQRDTNMTKQTPTSWVAMLKNLQRAIRNIDQHVKQLIHRGYKERRKRFAAKLVDNPAEEFRAIRETPARPIQFLADVTKAPTGQTNRCSKTSGFFTRRTYTERSNNRSQTSQLKNYATPSDMSRRTHQAQMHGKTSHSASSQTYHCDGWRECSTKSKGMKWPRQITEAHASCIPKERKASHDPLAYRILLIMSQVYRKWATRRLKAPWIQRWALPQMYAGVPGQGAEQAWWQLSLCLEHWKSQQMQATGGATDIYKCFDQIVTPLICMRARDAGIPARVLTPCINIMEGLRIRN